MSIYMALFIGFVGGLVRACQGAYKDSPWEPFVATKFIRSLVFGICGGVVWFVLLKLLNLEVHPALFLVMTVMFDSITTETYKRGIRVEDLRKYKMPTILHINGRIVHDRFLRGSIMLSLWISVFILFLYLSLLERRSPTIFEPVWLWGLFYGGLAGTMVSIGGALLDAAWEGFEPLKFFRSTIHGMIWGVIFSYLTSHVGVLMFAVLGMDRMGLEFYKSFIRKMKSGKFKAEKPQNPEWYKVRDRLLPLYLFGWLLFILLLAQR